MEFPDKIYTTECYLNLKNKLPDVNINVSEHSIPYDSRNDDCVEFNMNIEDDNLTPPYTTDEEITRHELSLTQESFEPHSFIIAPAPNNYNSSTLKVLPTEEITNPNNNNSIIFTQPIATTNTPCYEPVYPTGYGISVETSQPVPDQSCSNIPEGYRSSREFLEPMSGNFPDNKPKNYHMSADLTLAKTIDLDGIEPNTYRNSMEFPETMYNNTQPMSYLIDADFSEPLSRSDKRSIYRNSIEVPNPMSTSFHDTELKIELEEVTPQENVQMYRIASPKQSAPLYLYNKVTVPQDRQDCHPGQTGDVS